jgi:hypothetical protein
LKGLIQATVKNEVSILLPYSTLVRRWQITIKLSMELVY